MAIRKARLPSAYKEVEYIESTGTQYIDTQFIPSAVSKAICNVQFTNTNNQLCGVYASGSGRFQFGILTNQGFYVGIGSLSHYFQKEKDTNIHTFVLDNVNKIVSVDTESYYDSTISFNYTTAKFLLFGRTSNNAFDPGFACSMKLYSCKIYDNSILIRNFVPCYRVSDNEIGLYDMVNGVFYTNAGTGTFLKGNDVLPKIVKLYKGTTQIVKRYKGTNLIYSASRLPSAFQEVEYLESSGTQYIDTNYQTTSNIKIISKYQPTRTLYSNYSFIYFGSRKSTSDSNFAYNIGLNSVFIGTGTSQITLAKDNDLGIHNIEYGSSGYNIQSSTYNESGAFTLSIGTLLNLYIFARNDNGTVSSNGTYKLFTFQIYDNNILIRNFVPCYRKADNVAGLYDLVNGVFYTNAGTGTFIVGGNV